MSLIKTFPSHVAILVPSVRKAADYLSRFGFSIGNEEIWDGEGTKEIYVEIEKANSLLLMEAFKPGAYQSAMNKRGPGVHHLAVDVENLESYIDSLSGSGWLLHPKTLKTIKESRTAYLARPGFSSLIEVREQTQFEARGLFISSISLKMDASLSGLLKFAGLDSIVKASSETELIADGQKIKIENLF